MQLIKFLLIATILSLLIGQTVRLPFSESGAITISDILVFAVGFVFLIYSLTLKRSVKLPKEIFPAAMLFSLTATASLILASGHFSLAQLATSSMFLVRFLIYFFLAVIFYNVVEKSEIKNWVNLILWIGLIFAFLGFVQLFLIPDFTFLISFGWDPHIQRIASTFLDPNFTGGVLSILLAISLSLFLFSKENKYLFALAIFLIALILTFSRSSYLALLTVILTIGFLKSKKALIAIFIFLMAVFLVFGQVRSRVASAFTLDETSQARLQSWSQAITVFADNPIFGVGFNTYRFAQARYGFFTADEPLGGHSGAGTDSSMLLVAATTGIFGLIFYLYMILSIIKIFARSAKSNYLHLGSLAAFLGLLIHSQFVNSLFFPQLMLLVWMLVGLNLANDT